MASPFRTKTYVVLQRKNLAKEGEANVVVLDVKLTEGAAQTIVDKNPGSWIERFIADKQSGITPNTRPQGERRTRHGNSLPQSR